MYVLHGELEHLGFTFNLYNPGLGVLTKPSCLSDLREARADTQRYAKEIADFKAGVKGSLQKPFLNERYLRTMARTGR